VKAKRFWVGALGLCAAVVVLLPLAFAGARQPWRERVLSKVTFIHFRRAHARPPWAGGGSGGKPEKGYYEFIAKGARWRVLEDFVVNPTNGEGLADSFVVEAMSLGMAEWESYGGQILGAVSVDTTVGYNNGELDGLNTLSFGSIDDPAVIGVTTVWGYFSGPPRQREIVEADVLLNDDYVWGDAEADPTVMDVLNIATHEIGHCAGMGDVYDPAGDRETMYGYSTEGEIIKRDLYTGDIAGIRELYDQ